MATLTQIVFYLGLVAYSAASALFFFDLLRRNVEISRGPTAARWLVIGAAAHAAHMVMGSWISGVCPVGSLQFSLSLSAFIAVSTFLVLRRRLGLNALGALIAPLGLFFLVGAEFLQNARPDATQSLPKPLLLVHIAANFLGMGLFIFAGIAGGFYLIEERRLKTKRGTWLALKLPPLTALDRTTHGLALAGFPLLTIGLVTGAVFSSPASGAGLLRTFLGYSSWLLVAVVLALRHLAGFRGKRAAYGTLASVLCLLLVVLFYVVRGGAAS